MEIVREIRVRSEDLLSVVGSESGFSVKASGLLNELKGRKKVFVRVKDVKMPSDIKSISFFMNYVKMRKQTGEGTLSIDVPIESSDVDLLKVSINYLSMQDLCMQITQLANQLIESECMCHSPDHSKHVCEKVGLKDLCKISYVSERVVVKNGQGYVLWLCNVGATICGLEKSGLIETCKNDVEALRLEGQSLVGHRVSFFSERDHYCHVLLDAIIPKMYCDEKNFGVLFTFNNKTRSIENETGDVIRKVVCASDTLRFYMVDDDLKPIMFEKDLTSSGLRFTLMFICP